MANALANAAIGAGMAAGAAKTVDTLAQYGSPAAAASRAEAKAIKASADEALRRTQATRATPQDLANMGELQSQQLQQAVMTAQQANSQMLRQNTYSAFQRFNADGDTRHLNTMLEDMKQDPVGQRLFGDTARVDAVTANDAALLQQYGLDWENFSANPELAKGFVKATLANGQVGIVPMEMLYAGTGYDRYMRMQEIEEAQQRAEIFRLAQARSGAASSAAEREATIATDLLKPANFTGDWSMDNPEYQAIYLEELRRARQSARPAPSTADEREAQRQTMLDGQGQPDWQPGNPAYDQALQGNLQAIRANASRTSGMREQDEVEATKNSIDELAQTVAGSDFFSVQPGTPEMRRFERQIQRIERLGEVQLSSQDKQTITNIRELMAVGDIAKEITPAETGLIDRIANTFGRYVSDNVDGTGKTAAYSTFRNTLQYALYGASLTGTEVENMNRQLGTLGQQTGPILAQMGVALQQVKSRLQSISQLNDSYVSHYYLGMDETKINNMIDAIDGSIETLNRYSQPTPTAQQPTVGEARQAATGVAAPDPVVRQQQLDSLFNEVMGNM